MFDEDSPAREKSESRGVNSSGGFSKWRTPPRDLPHIPLGAPVDVDIQGYFSVKFYYL